MLHCCLRDLLCNRRCCHRHCGCNWRQVPCQREEERRPIRVCRCELRCREEIRHERREERREERHHCCHPCCNRREENREEEREHGREENRHGEWVTKCCFEHTCERR